MFRNPLTDGLVVVIILILFFGPKRLPLLGRSIGEGIKEFKNGITGGSSSDDEDKPQITAQSQAAAQPPAPTAAASAQPVQSAPAPTVESRPDQG